MYDHDSVVRQTPLADKYPDDQRGDVREGTPPRPATPSRNGHAPRRIIVPGEVERTPDRDAPSPEKPAFPAPVACADLQGEDEKNIWVWDGYIARKCFTVLSSHPKVGKTTMLSHLFKSMASGEPFLDRQVIPSNVLVVSEESQAQWKKRRDELHLENNLFFLCRPFFTKPTHGVWKSFLQFAATKAQTLSCDLICLDTLGSLWPVHNENDAAEMQEALAPIRYLTEVAAVLGNHHLKKAGGEEGTGARGSSSLTGFADVILELKRLDPADIHNCKRTIRGLGRFDSTPSELVVEFDRTNKTYIAHGDRQQANRSSAMAILQTMLPDEAPGMDYEAIRAAWPDDEVPRKSTIVAALDEGVRRQIWLKYGSGRRNNPFTYWVQK